VEYDRKSQERARYTGCQTRGKPAISPPPSGPDGVLPDSRRARRFPEPTMNSFELNKILGAILGTCLFLLALNITAGALFSAPKPPRPGENIAGPEEPGGGGGGAAAPAQDEPIEKRLASANVEKGETAAKKCQACHTFGKGEPNRVGPNLYGVVGRDRASEAG